MCPELQYLDVSGQRLRTLPSEVAKIATVLFAGNPDLDIQGITDWRSFLRERQARPMPAQRLKLVLVGKEGSGKTTLLAALKKKGGVNVSKNVSTDGIAEDSLVFKPKKHFVFPAPMPLYLQCFDFAGQEIYYPSHELFMSRQSLFLVVCSAVEVATSLATALTRVQYWLQKVKTFIGTSRSPVFLVLTGLDLLRKPEAKTLMQNFPTEKFVAGIDLSVLGPCWVSCKSGAGIKELRKAIETAARDPQRFPNIPEYTVQVEAKLRTITPDQFGRISIAAAEGIGTDLSRTRTALEYLEATGAILRFEGTRERPETACYIVRPILLADLFKDILTFRHAFVKTGHLLESDLFVHIWRDKDALWKSMGKDPEQEKSVLVDVLEQFELVVRSGNGKLLVPSLLPPEVSWWYDRYWAETSDNEVGRSIKLKFVLKGFFPKILHRCYHLGAEVETAWRTGILLKLGHALGSIRLDSPVLSLQVRYQDGRAGILLFSLLLSVVESVFETYGMGSQWQHLETRIPYRSSTVSYQDCVHLFNSGQTHINIGSECVALDLLIPEVTMAHIKRIPETSLRWGNALGEGSYGVVLQAEMEGQAVAVKFIKTTGEKDLISLVRDFSREVEVMRRLKHPCLVHMYGMTKSADWALPGLVMEFIKGGDLCHDFHYNDPDVLGALNRWKTTEKSLSLVQQLFHSSDSRSADEIVGADLAVHQPALHWKLRSAAFSQDLLATTVEELRNESENSWSSLAPRLLESDRRISLEIRVRLLLDVATALNFLHTLSPPFVHNDVRSPNVFLLQIEDPSQQVAKLADFGLARIAAGGLRMGLNSWQWLAPEVLDHRRAATFSVQADIFSFGIICWEVLNGPGINVPYAEYEGEFKNVTNLKQAIREAGLRPRMTPYAESTFANDPLFASIKELMARCLLSSPTERPNAEEAVFALRTMLGIPTAPPAPRPLLAPQLRLQRSLSYNVKQIPRRSTWICSGCGRKNENEALKKPNSSCKCGQKVGRKVLSLTWQNFGPWLGLENGTVAEVLEKETKVYAFPSNLPVLLLCSGKGSVWATTSAFLMHIEQRLGSLIALDCNLGAPVGLVHAGEEAWLLQCKGSSTEVTVFRGNTVSSSFSVHSAVRAANSSNSLIALATDHSVLLYKEGTLIFQISLPLEQFTPRLIWLNEQQHRVVVASTSTVAQFALDGRLIRKSPTSRTILSICGPWTGTASGLFSTKGKVAPGRIDCLMSADGFLWAMDNDVRLLCAYHELVPDSVAE